jgi:hypothetical protein
MTIHDDSIAYEKDWSMSVERPEPVGPCKRVFEEEDEEEEADRSKISNKLREEGRSTLRGRGTEAN